MKRASITEELAYGTALDRLTGVEKPVSAPAKAEPTKRPKMAMIKLSVFLNREENTYLETLASTARFSGGRKISKTRLIKAMVQAFSTAKLDVHGVRTDEELIKRVTAQLRK